MSAGAPLLLLATISALILSKAHSSCLCTEFQSSCWPDLAAWNELNSSVDGRLIRVLPPAAPCHDDHFDQQACSTARNRWTSPFWRSDQPGAMQASIWEASGDNRCLISSPRNSTCSQGSVPVYAVSALAPSHVQAAVKFASDKNLRLVIKNTGHDYFGRSTAAGSLSIWTHNMKNISFYDDFVAKRCQKDRSSGPVSAVTVGAGVQWEEVYQAVTEQRKVVVGGGCASVGAAGGFLQGGGHSVLGSSFGMAADNVLEFEVVKADGELVTANSCQNKDLFWALRGGGGGTFGVVLSATHRTHPLLDNIIAASYNITFTDGSSLRDLLKAFSSINPSLSDAGWTGIFVFSGSSRTFLVSYVLPNKNEFVANKTLAPFLDFVERHPGLQSNGSLITLPSYEAWRLQFNCDGQSSCFNITSNPTTGLTALSSRLIPRSLFHNPASVEDLSQALASIVERYPVLSINSVLVAGAVTRPRVRNAVNPAWRHALWHVIIGSNWNDSATLEEQRELARTMTDANKMLIDLTPGSGAYINEADYNEPNWQQSLFGWTYPRLYAIKQKMDPSGVFRCHHCVGSERWSDDLNCDV